MMALPNEPKKVEISAPEKPELLDHQEQRLVKESDTQRISDLEDQMKRLQAEFENYKKRTAKEKEALAAIGSASTILKLLPVLDEMEVAIEAMGRDPGAKSLKHGVEMLHRKLLSVLEKEGLSEMKVQGEPFDPYRHEAVRTVEGKEDGKVADVMKKGYLFKGSVLRHAMVVVTKKKEENAEAKK
jgi:molecular chaperone GrpE